MASLHNTILFHYPRNYLDNGERVTERGTSNIVRQVTDNDYTTFSTALDMDVDISDGTNPTRVDAVYILSSGLATHRADATGGTGTGYTARTMPTTVTRYDGVDVPTEFNGFQHDLYLLDNHFIATDVRMRFTGTNVRIYALLLLEIGISLNANKRDFQSVSGRMTDRTSQVKARGRGRIRRVNQIGATRAKWELDLGVRVIPDRTTLTDVETLVNWRTENPNFACVQEFSRFPQRGCFPSVWLGETVTTRLRGQNRQRGYVQTVQIAEQ